MKTLALSPFQIAALLAIQAAAERRGWKGETAVVESMLVYQVPLPYDPDVAGAFFAIDSDETNILFYFLLPLAVAKPSIAEASEFVARRGFGMRFGALELDMEHGTLRVRVDCDASEAEVGEAAERLIERGRYAARQISADWRRLCHDTQAAESVVQDALSGRVNDDH